MEKKKLSEKEKQQVIEEVFGVSLRYLRPEGNTIKVLVSQYEIETSNKFIGFNGKFPAEILINGR